MIEAYMRPLFQKLFIDPLVNRYSKFLSPNIVTFLAFLCGATILPALFFQQIILAFSLLIVSGYLDILDGAVARFRDETSNLGTIFDILSDRFVEACIIIGMYGIDPNHRGLLSLCMLGSVLICVTSFLLVGIFTPNDSNKGFYYSSGLMERAEAFLFFGLMMLLPQFFKGLAISFSFLVILTAIIRVMQFSDQLNQIQKVKT